MRVGLDVSLAPGRAEVGAMTRAVLVALLLSLPASGLAQRAALLQVQTRPRTRLQPAALTADKIAGTAEFFSFGTNDLTQMRFGFSRDDTGGFVPENVEKKILPADSFQILDREGVSQLVQMASELTRDTSACTSSPAASGSRRAWPCATLGRRGPPRG